MSVTTKATIASFGGKLLKLSHAAASTKCEMNFNLYLPPQAFQDPSQKIPVLIYLTAPARKALRYSTQTPVPVRYSPNP
ncbi:hypothetical protein CNMCM8057_008416 [Aspergillus fumigatus]|nr:hypothetical protein CNMCM8057_008416 [Aspergillus fumigatus]